VKCPQYGCGGNLKVTHTYTVDQGSTKRACCEKCGTVCVVHSEIVAINPSRGHGAAAYARKKKEGGS